MITHKQKPDILPTNNTTKIFSLYIKNTAIFSSRCLNRTKELETILYNFGIECNINNYNTNLDQIALKIWSSLSPIQKISLESTDCFIWKQPPMCKKSI